MKSIDVKVLKVTGQVEFNKEMCGVLFNNVIDSLFPPFWTITISDEESSLLRNMSLNSPSFKLIKKDDGLFIRFTVYNTYEVLKAAHKIRYIINEFKKQLIINRMAFILNEDQYDKLDSLIDLSEEIIARLVKKKSKLMMLGDRIKIPTVEQLILYPDEGIEKLEAAIYMIKRA